MFRNKLKKIVCITLATVMTFSGLQVQVKDAKAAYKEASSYKFFADAVEDLYKGNTTGVSGDYELANFSDNYEYSVVKKDYTTLKSVNTSSTNTQVKDSCLWEGANVITGTQGGTGTSSASTSFKAGLPKSIEYLKHIEGQSLKNVGSSTNDSSSIKWNYDLVNVTMNYDNFMHSSSSVNYIVNVRPQGSVKGSVTLPAYIKVDGYGLVPCVEVGDGAFLKNTELTEVNIPDTYQRICAYAFTGCEALKSVKFITTEKNENNGIGFTINTSTSVEENMKNSNIHMIGAGAFAGCKKLSSALLPTKLTEGYMLSDNYFATYKPCDLKGNALVNESISEITVDMTKQGDYIEDGKYFLGQGVYRDCYGIESVEIKGYNPFIPANTFAGCSKISSIKVDDTVKNIIFGIASFAGADGNNADSEKSSLKELVLDSESLQTVTICAYAFKNNFQLKNVTIKADLNPNKIYTKVQRAYHLGENAFENSFNSGKFIYEPKSRKDFTIQEGFFKNCKMSEIKLLENVYTEEGKPQFWSEPSNTLKIEKYAFEGAECKKLNLKAYRVEPHTSAFYGLNTEELTISGIETYMYGEPFSNSYRERTSDNVTLNLKNIIMGAKMVYFKPESIVDSYYDDSYGVRKVLNSHTSTSVFYGVSENTNLVFTEKVEAIDSYKSSKVRVYYSQNKGKTLEVADNRIIDRNFLGKIKNVYIQGYNTKVLAFTEDQIGEQGNTGWCTTVYADGTAYNTVASNVKNLLHIKAQGYTNAIESASTYWVNTETDFKPGRVSSTIGEGVVVRLANGEYQKIDYAEEEQKSGSTVGINGYIISNLDNVKSDVSNGKNSTKLSINYRGLTGTIDVSIVPKSAVSFSVTTNGSFIEGTTPDNKNFVISGVKYNDDSTEEIVSDNSNLKVTLVEGAVYKNGSNMVDVAYMGHTERAVVNAEAEKVVTMSAIQATEKIYPGSNLSQKDLTVTAYYNSGRVDNNFTDYEIVTKEITESTKFVTIKSANGVEAVVDLIVTLVTAKSLSVAYNGMAVQEGTEVKKKNFKVTVMYDNNTSRVLEDDEYDLVYAPIVGNSSNSVKVVYKANPEITETVYVAGVMEVVTDAPETEAPVVTKAPNSGSNIDSTNEPTVTNSTNPTDSSEPVKSDVPTNSSVPTKKPIESGKPVATTPVTTTLVSISATPTATAKPTQTSTTLTNNKVPNTNVTSGNSVTADVELKTTKTSIMLGVGEKAKVTISGSTSLNYKTSNSKILVVTSKGIVTAKKVGTAQITVTDSKGNTKICTITVKKAPKKVKVNFTKKSLKKGKKATIKVSFPKGYYSKTRVFKSSNKKVATVNTKGVVVAKKKGTCKITVKTYNGKKAVIKITVK